MISFAIKAIEEMHTRLFNFYLASNYMTSFDVTVTSLLSKFGVFFTKFSGSKVEYFREVSDVKKMISEFSRVPGLGGGGGEGGGTCPRSISLKVFMVLKWHLG